MAQAPSTSAPVVADTQTDCPIPGSFGNGTPTSADAAYAALTPDPALTATTPSSLAFTGGHFVQESAAGGLLIAAGGYVVWRTRRRPVALADGLDHEDTLEP